MANGDPCPLCVRCTHGFKVWNQCSGMAALEHARLQYLLVAAKRFIAYAKGVDVLGDCDGDGDGYEVPKAAARFRVALELAEEAVAVVESGERPPATEREEG